MLEDRKQRPTWNRYFGATPKVNHYASEESTWNMVKRFIHFSLQHISGAWQKVRTEWKDLRKGMQIKSSPNPKAETSFELCLENLDECLGEPK